MANKGFQIRPNLRLLRSRRKSAVTQRMEEEGLVAADHRGPRAGLYLFPNLFTSASLFLALWAIVRISEGMAAIALKQQLVADGHFVMACWLILFAALCDAIDGPVARWTRTSSSFGINFDSLADVVAFGVAPAFLMYTKLRSLDEELPVYAPKLALGACALFAICSAVRLARFNVQATTTEKNYFTGLPTPGAAGTIVTAFLFVLWLTELPFIVEYVNPSWLARNLHRSILVLMVALSLLMVSEIPFPKLKNLVRISRKPFNTLVCVILAICLLITFQSYLQVVLFGAFAFYLLATIVVHLRRNLKGTPKAPVAETGEGRD